MKSLTRIITDNCRLELPQWEFVSYIWILKLNFTNKWPFLSYISATRSFTRKVVWKWEVDEGNVFDVGRETAQNRFNKKNYFYTSSPCIFEHKIYSLLKLGCKESGKLFVRKTLWIWKKFVHNFFLMMLLKICSTGFKRILEILWTCIWSTNDIFLVD